MLFSRKRKRSDSGASLTDYALIVGLISIGAIGAVAATGGRVSDLYDRIGSRMAETGTGEPGDSTETPAPTVSLTTSTTLIRTDAPATFSWETVGADSIAASYVLAPSCPELDTRGPGPHALPWSRLDGAAEIGWDLERAGCTMTIELVAINEAGRATATASVTFEAPDTTPETLAFDAIAGAEPGSTASSAPVTVRNVNASTTIAGGAPDVRVSLAGDPIRTPSLTVAPGAQIELHATAPAGFAETRSVPFTAGSLSGTWLVTTRARDTEALISSLGPDALGLDASVTRQSHVATLSDFDGPLDLTISRSTTSADNGTVRYRKNGGAPVTLGATNPVMVPVNSQDVIQIEYVAPSTYKATALDIATTIAIGSTGASRTWTAGIRAGRSCSPAPVTFVGITGAVCTATLPLTVHGLKAPADDETGDTQGRATYECRDGTWVPPVINGCASGYTP